MKLSCPHAPTPAGPALPACACAAMLGFCHAKNDNIDADYRARLFNYGQFQVTGGRWHVP